MNPEAQGHQRHQRAHYHQGHQYPLHQPVPVPQAHRRDAPRHALPGACMATATQAQLQAHQQHAQGQQQGGEHRRVGVAELQFELLIDGGGEGLVAHDRRRAELHQHVQRHQQAGAHQHRAQQRQGHPPEHLAPGVTEHARGLFQGRVEVAQSGHHRQVHQRVLGQHHHQHRAPQPLECRAEGNPTEAGDEGRDGERQAEQHVPLPATAQVAALHTPGQRQAEQCAAGGDRHHQLQGVAQQVEHEGPPQQLPGGVPAGLPTAHCHVEQRQGRHQQQRHDRHLQPDRRRASPAAGHQRGCVRQRRVDGFGVHQFSPTSRSSSRASSARPMSEALSFGGRSWS